MAMGFIPPGSKKRRDNDQVAAHPVSGEARERLDFQIFEEPGAGSVSDLEGEHVLGD